MEWINYTSLPHSPRTQAAYSLGNLVLVPATITSIPEDEILGLVEQGDVAQLETVVLSGQGGKLWGITSDDEAVNNFLIKVPDYVSQIETLHTAIKNGNSTHIEKLLSENQKLNAAKDNRGLYPIHTAVLYNQSEIITNLLQKCPDCVLLTDNNGRTALHYAAILNDNGKCYNFLKDNGADPKAMDKDNKSPSYFLEHQGELDLTQVEQSKYTVQVMSFDNEDSSKEVIGYEGSLENDDLNYLEQMVLEGRGRELLGQISENSEVEEFLECVPIYLSKIEALHTAINCGSFRDVKMMLDRKKLVLAKDSMGACPLHNAVLRKHEKIVRYLASEFPNYVDVTDREGRTPLHYAAVVDDNIYCKILLEAGANPSIEDKYGNTAEYYIENPDALNYKTLLEKNYLSCPPESYPDESSIENQPPEELSLYQIQQLLLSGRGEQLIGLSSSDEYINEYLENVPQFIIQIENLHSSIKDGDFSKVQTLLQNSLFISAQDCAGAYPIHNVILYKQIKIFQFILEKFPYCVNVCDNCKYTPLHYAAVIQNGEEYFNGLIEAGADEKLKDKHGNPACYYLNHPGELTEAHLLNKDELSCQSSNIHHLTQEQNQLILQGEKTKLLKNTTSIPPENITDILNLKLNNVTENGSCVLKISDKTLDNKFPTERSSKSDNMWTRDEYKNIKQNEVYPDKSKLTFAYAQNKDISGSQFTVDPENIEEKIFFELEEKPESKNLMKNITSVENDTKEIIHTKEEFQKVAQSSENIHISNHNKSVEKNKEVTGTIICEETSPTKNIITSEKLEIDHEKYLCKNDSTINDKEKELIERDESTSSQDEISNKIMNENIPDNISNNENSIDMNNILSETNIHDVKNKEYFIKNEESNVTALSDNTTINDSQISNIMEKEIIKSNNSCKESMSPISKTYEQKYTVNTSSQEEISNKFMNKNIQDNISNNECSIDIVKDKENFIRNEESNVPTVSDKTFINESQISNIVEEEIIKSNSCKESMSPIPKTYEQNYTKNRLFQEEIENKLMNENIPDNISNNECSIDIVKDKENFIRNEESNVPTLSDKTFINESQISNIVEEEIVKSNRCKESMSPISKTYEQKYTINTSSQEEISNKFMNENIRDNISNNECSIDIVKAKENFIRNEEGKVPTVSDKTFINESQISNIVEEEIIKSNSCKESMSPIPKTYEQNYTKNRLSQEEIENKLMNENIPDNISNNECSIDIVKDKENFIRKEESNVPTFSDKTTTNESQIMEEEIIKSNIYKESMTPIPKIYEQKYTTNTSSQEEISNTIMNKNIPDNISNNENPIDIVKDKENFIRHEESNVPILSDKTTTNESQLSNIVEEEIIKSNSYKEAISSIPKTYEQKYTINTSSQEEISNKIMNENIPDSISNNEYSMDIVKDKENFIRKKESNVPTLSDKTSTSENQISNIIEEGIIKSNSYEESTLPTSLVHIKSGETSQLISLSKEKTKIISEITDNSEKRPQYDDTDNIFKKTEENETIISNLKRKKLCDITETQTANSITRNENISDNIKENIISFTMADQNIKYTPEEIIEAKKSNTDIRLPNITLKDKVSSVFENESESVIEVNAKEQYADIKLTESNDEIDQIAGKCDEDYIPQMHREKHSVISKNKDFYEEETESKLSIDLYQNDNKNIKDENRLIKNVEIIPKIVTNITKEKNTFDETINEEIKTNEIFSNENNSNNIYFIKETINNTPEINSGSINNEVNLNMKMNKNSDENDFGENGEEITLEETIPLEKSTDLKKSAGLENDFTLKEFENKQSMDKISINKTKENTLDEEKQEKLVTTTCGNILEHVIENEIVNKENKVLHKHICHTIQDNENIKYLSDNGNVKEIATNEVVEEIIIPIKAQNIEKTKYFEKKELSEEGLTADNNTLHELNISEKEKISTTKMEESKKTDYYSDKMKINENKMFLDKESEKAHEAIFANNLKEDLIDTKRKHDVDRDVNHSSAKDEKFEDIIAIDYEDTKHPKTLNLEKDTIVISKIQDNKDITYSPKNEEKIEEIMSINNRREMVDEILVQKLDDNMDNNKTQDSGTIKCFLEKKKTDEKIMANKNEKNHETILALNLKKNIIDTSKIQDNKNIKYSLEGINENKMILDKESEKIHEAIFVKDLKEDLIDTKKTHDLDKDINYFHAKDKKFEEIIAIDYEDTKHPKISILEKDTIVINKIQDNKDIIYSPESEETIEEIIDIDNKNENNKIICVQKLDDNMHNNKIKDSENMKYSSEEKKTNGKIMANNNDSEKKHETIFALNLGGNIIDINKTHDNKNIKHSLENDEILEEIMINNNESKKDQEKIFIQNLKEDTLCTNNIYDNENIKYSEKNGVLEEIMPNDYERERHHEAIFAENLKKYRVDTHKIEEFKNIKFSLNEEEVNEEIIAVDNENQKDFEIIFNTTEKNKTQNINKATENNTDLKHTSKKEITIDPLQEKTISAKILEENIIKEILNTTIKNEDTNQEVKYKTEIDKLIQEVIYKTTDELTSNDQNQFNLQNLDKMEVENRAVNSKDTNEIFKENIIYETNDLHGVNYLLENNQSITNDIKTDKASFVTSESDIINKFNTNGRKKRNTCKQENDISDDIIYDEIDITENSLTNYENETSAATNHLRDVFESISENTTGKLSSDIESLKQNKSKEFQAILENLDIQKSEDNEQLESVANKIDNDTNDEQIGIIKNKSVKNTQIIQSETIQDNLTEVEVNNDRKHSCQEHAKNELQNYTGILNSTAIQNGNSEDSQSEINFVLNNYCQEQDTQSTISESNSQEQIILPNHDGCNRQMKMESFDYDIEAKTIHTDKNENSNYEYIINNNDVNNDSQELLTQTKYEKTADSNENQALHCQDITDHEYLLVTQSDYNKNNSQSQILYNNQQKHATLKTSDNSSNHIMENENNKHDQVSVNQIQTLQYEVKDHAEKQAIDSINNKDVNKNEQVIQNQDGKNKELVNSFESIYSGQNRLSEENVFNMEEQNSFQKEMENLKIKTTTTNENDNHLQENEKTLTIRKEKETNENKINTNSKLNQAQKIDVKSKNLMEDEILEIEQEKLIIEDPFSEIKMDKCQNICFQNNEELIQLNKNRNEATTLLQIVCNSNEMINTQLLADTKNVNNITDKITNNENLPKITDDKKLIKKHYVQNKMAPENGKKENMTAKQTLFNTDELENKTGIIINNNINETFQKKLQDNDFDKNFQEATLQNQTVNKLNETTKCKSKDMLKNNTSNYEMTTIVRKETSISKENIDRRKNAKTNKKDKRKLMAEAYLLKDNVVKECLCISNGSEYQSGTSFPNTNGNIYFLPKIDGHEPKTEAGKYLMRVLGDILFIALAEVAEYRPYDPIDHLAQWLYKYEENIRIYKKLYVSLNEKQNF